MLKDVADLSLPPLRNHQAAVVDFSGDCQSDLVLLAEDINEHQYL